MFREFGSANISAGVARSAMTDTALARSGELDALIALEQIGTRRLYRRDEEIYAEGEASAGWYKVVSGAVRITKQLADDDRGMSMIASNPESTSSINDRAQLLRLPDRLLS